MQYHGLLAGRGRIVRVEGGEREPIENRACMATDVGNVSRGKHAHAHPRVQRERGRERERERQADR